MITIKRWRWTLYRNVNWMRPSPKQPAEDVTLGVRWTNWLIDPPNSLLFVEFGGEDDSSAADRDAMTGSSSVGARSRSPPPYEWVDNFESCLRNGANWGGDGSVLAFSELVRDNESTVTLLVDPKNWELLSSSSLGDFFNIRMRNDISILDSAPDFDNWYGCEAISMPGLSRRLFTGNVYDPISFSVFWSTIRIWTQSCSGLVSRNV